MLDCGCSRYHECPEAVRLWAEATKQYSLCKGKPTAFYRWDAYDEAIAEYHKHKNPVQERREGWV